MTDAEDVVQEAWIRWQRVDAATIDSPAAYLTTVTSRLGLDRLRSRYRHQAEYVGPWLPEPLLRNLQSPEEMAELSDSLTTAFLVMLERLVSRRTFGRAVSRRLQEPFGAVAQVVGKKVEATRQVASRARRKLRSEPPCVVDPPAASRRAADGLAAALLAGDMEYVKAVAAADVVLVPMAGA